MRKSDGGILVIETLMVLPIIIFVFIFFLESWRFVYYQQAINQVVNYAGNYWAKNSPNSCNNIETWVLNNALKPALDKFNIDKNDIEFTLDYPTQFCNCAGSTISITAELKGNWKYGFINPKSSVILIKEGDLGENC